MNDQQLQEAIDKARFFLAPQIDYKTPSLDLKESTIKYIKELQAIQVMRAEMATTPTLQLREKNT